MKKILIVMFTLGLAFGASAQRFHGGGRVFYGGGPRVIVGVGAYAPFYSPFYSPFYPFGYPYGYGYNRPSKLDLKIQDIRNDYKDRIWSVKHDDSLTHKEKRQKVHELKQERDRDINDTKRNYYKTY